MFKDHPQQTQETDTVIGPSVKVEGDFVAESNMIIEGIVAGSIKTEKNLKAGSKSKIFANISASNAFISGEIQGNIKVSGKLELASTAKIFGDIKAQVLVVSNGSIINGKCQMGGLKEKSPRPDFSKQGKIELKTKAAGKTDKSKSRLKK